MRKLLIFMFVSLIISGCSDPKDIVFGPDPLKQIAEQGDQFRKLSEEDRTLLVGYLSISAMGKAFGAEVKPATGRTVGEVLVDARAWKEKIKLAEAESKRREQEREVLKAKILGERKMIADKIASSVVVAVTDKKVLPKNFEAGRYAELLVLNYAIENKSNKSIKQLKGTIHFYDATGEEVGFLPVDFDIKLRAGKILKTDTGRGWRLNEFMRGDIEKIAARDFSSMKTKFEADAIAFEGGEVLKAPELK